ncbi:MAG: hypothetical protein J7L96_05295 [Bacteroidales bacterium]|nr:hypothetical protein [Bacteroidales bacterium]
MKKILLVLPLYLFALLPISLSAQSLELPNIFGDNMVLQQNETISIWGWAGRSEEITIVSSWGDTVKVKADVGTRWKAKLNTPVGGYTPQSLLISGKNPNQTILLKNILIGEVWLASGQSNMYQSSSRLQIPGLDHELGQANIPGIRVFNVALRASETPQDNLQGSWQVCTPDIMQNTSGTGYFFAKNLHQSLDCPVGIIVDAWGGTPIEFWYPKEAFQHSDELIASAERLSKHRQWPTSEAGTGYNAMTYPIGSYSIAGMLWYQGEANVFDPMTYAEKMAILIKERRKQFGPGLPVYYVQIAPYKYSSNSAILRDQQRQALKIWNTGMVVCSDIGDTSNIHPRDKVELGARLANLALKKHYKTIDKEVESPVFESAILHEGCTYVSFQHSEGLFFSGKEKGFFEVSIDGKKYETVKASIIEGKIKLDTRKIKAPKWVRFAFTNTATPVLFNGAGLPASCFAPQKIKAAPKVHMVSDLSHEFTFYADHRFDQQYLPEQKAVTNWCNLYNFDFTNTNLLVLLGCDNRIGYLDKDMETIDGFLKSGGGVVVFGFEKSTSQNALLKQYGAEFTGLAKYPLSSSEEITQTQIEGKGGSVLDFEQAKKWKVLISDSNEKALLAKRKIGKGTLLVSSRSLSGSNPNASDSINKDIWKPLLIETASGKAIDPNKPFRTLGIDDLEYNDDHGTFKLSYNDYLKPSADAMVDVYKRSIPFIEKRMGVPLSPGMASQVTLLSTGGGGFSSGTVVALAVWWGGFPEREDGMIEFLTHESVHSWVLPFAEVWNEPIATYIGNLVMMDMGHEKEALRRIKSTIERASKLDPDMKNYDLHGNLTGTGKELTSGEKNNIHWGKSYWVWEQLRKENPTIVADYFKLKRRYARPELISKYDIHSTVALLSKAMGRDLFPWFNEIGIPANPEKTTIRLD